MKARVKMLDMGSDFEQFSLWKRGFTRVSGWVLLLGSLVLSFQMARGKRKQITSARIVIHTVWCDGALFLWQTLQKEWQLAKVSLRWVKGGVHQSLVMDTFFGCPMLR